MSCPSCRSRNQAEFPSELLIHFAGFENLKKSGVWVFPTLKVCMDCGLTHSTIPASELALLASGTSTAEATHLGDSV
jgi:hypothetical protein